MQSGTWLVAGKISGDGYLSTLATSKKGMYAIVQRDDASDEVYYIEERGLAGMLRGNVLGVSEQDNEDKTTIKTRAYRGDQVDAQHWVVEDVPCPK
jgi:hypothetical protein